MSNPKMILLVEDNPQDAELARNACQVIEGAYDIIHVPEGEDALDYLHCRGNYQNRDRNKEPSLILLNLDIPSMKALQAIREMRTHSKTQALPIILMTSSQEALEIAKAYEFGANSYIHKPRNFDEFVRVLRGLTTYWFDIVKPAPIRKCPD